jgi:hypothetical protein
MSIAFITLTIVFVLTWTIGDASRLSCQPLHWVQFVSCMSSGVITLPWVDTIVKYGTIENVAME